MIKEIIINEPLDLISQLLALPNKFAYRGHANSQWKLQSTLERTLINKYPNLDAVKFEDHSLKLFKSKFHLYSEHEKTPTSLLGWLAMMQHYGVPTRLLDLTTSPLVALYFAIENYAPSSANDLAVYAFDYSELNNIGLRVLKTMNPDLPADTIGQESQEDIFEKFINMRKMPIIWVAEPSELNSRLDRQAGCFLASGDPNIGFEKLLKSDFYAECVTYKFQISSSLYESIYVLLRKSNINGKIIYGDLQGLAREIQMELVAYSS